MQPHPTLGPTIHNRMTYARPPTLDAAIRHLAQSPARLLAGGTDLYPATQAPELSGPILDLTSIPELSGITPWQGGLRIGATTSWSTLAEATLPPALAALQSAARQVGGRQIQNAGTIGGNLCNASPAADGIPPLLILDALVELVGPLGTRQMPLSTFLIGPRRTACAKDEILTAIFIPEQSLAGRSSFLKLGARAYLVISIAMVAARLDLAADGTIRSISLSVGACGPVATRLPGLEAALTGLPVALAIQHVTPQSLEPFLSPISDIRASGTYRLDAAAELLRRAIVGCAP